MKTCEGCGKPSTKKVRHKRVLREGTGPKSWTVYLCDYHYGYYLYGKDYADKYCKQEQ